MSTGRLIVGIFILLLGVSWLVGLDVLKVLFPLIIIGIGLAILLDLGPRGDFTHFSASHEDIIRRVLIFSGMNNKFESSDFQKAEIVAIFGGGEADFRNVKTKSDTVTLDFVAIFGGLKVYVPDNWQIRSEGAGVLGGFNNQTHAVDKNKVIAYVKGAAIFGGVEIVN